MKESYQPNLHLALMHYPVVNKNGETIASAVTNLDLHDISRAAKTYGVHKVFIVTPLKDQKALVEEIVSHWETGFGAKYNPTRSEALELVDIKETFEEVLDYLKKDKNDKVKTVVTSAKNNSKSINYQNLRKDLQSGETYLLLFGTAWGLSNDFISNADYVLEPIRGTSEYNHLSVRSAVSIILDRLVGNYN